MDWKYNLQLCTTSTVGLITIAADYITTDYIIFLYNIIYYMTTDALYVPLFLVLIWLPIPYSTDG